MTKAMLDIFNDRQCDGEGVLYYNYESHDDDAVKYL